MRNGILLFVVLMIMLCGACKNDDSYKPDDVPVTGNGQIELALTGRAGTVIGDSLADYVHSLNLFLFRENEAGEYTLFRTVTLGKEELRALKTADDESEAGYTVYQHVTFDSLPLAHYKIVGLGNALDSLGQEIPGVSLTGVADGNMMSQVLASVTNDKQAPRFFWGITSDIAVGSSQTEFPVLRMNRKVAMFSLTLEKIPDVVDKINMTFGNTYGAFNMGGGFEAGSNIFVYASTSYAQQVKDQITINYVMLPTVENEKTTIEATFYLFEGPKINVTFPEYVLKQNTITKVTATIDTDSGEKWKVDLNTLITVNVEWNVDQEPPITI